MTSPATRGVLTATAVFTLTVACAPSSPANAPGAAGPPSGVEQRDIIRCSGDWSDSSYFRTEASSCDLVARAYERDGRVPEALRTWARACELASESRDELICDRLISSIDASARDLSPGDLAHYRAIAKGLCFGRRPAVCATVGRLFEQVEPKDLQTARDAWKRDCEKTADYQACSKAEELGQQYSQSERAAQDAKRASNREYQRVADDIERDRRQREAQDEERRLQLEWEARNHVETPIETGLPSSEAASLDPASAPTQQTSAPNRAPQATPPARPPLPPPTAKPTSSPSSSTPKSAPSSAPTSRPTSNPPPPPPPPPTTPPAPTTPPTAAPPPPPPQKITFAASGATDFGFADDMSCCQKLFASPFQAQVGLSRACSAQGAHAKMETARYAAASCSAEQCGPGCGYKYRCRALAEGTCER